MSAGRDLEVMLGEPKHAIRSLAVTLSLSYLVIQLNLFVDTFFTSGLGDVATSAVAMMNPIYWIVCASGIGLGVGASSTIAFRMGENNRERANSIAGNSLILGLLCSVVASAAIAVCIDPVITLMGADDVREDSKAYVVPFIVLASALVLNGIVSGLLRAEGAGKKSMIVLVISALINMIMDPVLIYGLDMKVAGAGWATSVGALVSVILGLHWYARGQMNVKISFRPDTSAMREVFGIGGPRTAEALVTGVTNIFQRIFIVIAGGTVAVMLYNTPFKYTMLVVVVAEALGAAMVPVCSAALGQKDVPKMKSGMTYAARLSFVITSVLALFVFIFADQLMSVFTYNETMAAHKEDLVWTLRMLCIMTPFDGLRKIGSCMMQVLRKSGLSTIAVLLWGILKLGIYAALCVYSFRALMYGCVGVYIFGGVFMVALAWYYAGKVDEDHIPKEPGTC